MSHRQMSSNVWVRRIFLVTGWISVVLGTIGAILPVVPTVPFLILAAFLFSKGSPRWHKWLLERPVVGEQIREWESDGIIRPRAKIMATLMILSVFASTLYFVPVAPWIKGVIASIGIIVLLFVVTRPTEVKEKSHIQ